jgi:hypothetical protein
MSNDERNKIGWEARAEMPAKLRQIIQEIKYWQEFEPDPVYSQLAQRIVSCAESIALTIEHYDRVSRNMSNRQTAQPPAAAERMPIVVDTLTNVG